MIVSAFSQAVLAHHAPQSSCFRIFNCKSSCIRKTLFGICFGFRPVPHPM